MMILYIKLQLNEFRKPNGTHEEEEISKSKRRKKEIKDKKLKKR